MDIKNNLKKYHAIIGYGIGQDYNKMKRFFDGKLVFDYLADKKWEDSNMEEYDGIPIIRLRQLKQMKGALIVLFPRFASVRDVILRELEGVKSEICYVHDIFPTERCIRSEELIELLPKTELSRFVSSGDTSNRRSVCEPACVNKLEFVDDFQNKVVYDETIPANIKIFFTGRNSMVKIGHNLAVNHLEIYCENDGICLIGNRTSVEEARLYVSGAKLQLGEDCMVSRGVRIRTHDKHHIFDKSTHKRINYPQEVVIGNKVWIGQDVVILAGSNIGTGSIVGERAVTSSVFGKHVIIAGCPAKVIREDICWSRDGTGFFNHERLEECYDDTAFKYMSEND